MTVRVVDGGGYGMLRYDQQVMGDPERGVDLRGPDWTALALAFGVSLVLPIGGADMPVVISLLNSYAGLASAATGFAIGNNVLIIAGALALGMVG